MVGGLTIHKFGVRPRTRWGRECPTIHGMGRQLIVELDEDLPPSGRVIAPDGSSVRFAGWTELAQALTPETDPTANPDGEAPAGSTPPG
jgi:hypothetical protein